jgi:hypothetical protein
MASPQMTSSAALFSTATYPEPVSLNWFENVVKVFELHGLTPIFFTAGGSNFELDDCWLLEDDGPGVFRWEVFEPIRPGRINLLKDLQDGAIHTLALDSPRPDGNDRDEWRARVSASSISANLYVGLEEQLAPDLAHLLRQAYLMSRGSYTVHYGFAYKMPLDELPGSYAGGSRRFTYADFQDLLRRRREGIKVPPSPDELWKQEVRDTRRHLTGLFRAAYPANLLSEAHVQSAQIETSGLGRLSKLDERAWLWELTGKELPQAQAMLEARGVLVSQAVTQVD